MRFIVVTMIPPSAVQNGGNCADPAKNNCDVNAECIDVHPGRHFCTCKIGYIGDGMRCDGEHFGITAGSA